MVSIGTSYSTHRLNIYLVPSLTSFIPESVKARDLLQYIIPMKTIVTGLSHSVPPSLREIPGAVKDRLPNHVVNPICYPGGYIFSVSTCDQPGAPVPRAAAGRSSNDTWGKSAEEIFDSGSISLSSNQEYLIHMNSICKTKSVEFPH